MAANLLHACLSSWDEFTHAQFGQQYTTIDGAEFITYFGLADPKLKRLKPAVPAFQTPFLKLLASRYVSTMKQDYVINLLPP